MSLPELTKEKLAEALLGVVSSTRNYDVIPPSPYELFPAQKAQRSGSDYYITENDEVLSNSIRRAAEIGGYSWVAQQNFSSHYSSLSSSSTTIQSSCFNEDSYESAPLGTSNAIQRHPVEVDAKHVAKRLAHRLAQDMHLNRDFNKEYQALMEQVETGNNNMNTLTQLRLLTKEFLDTAQSAGCIIIDELFEPLKTIPPVDIGGIAGGVKYVYRNILYKICLDTELDENRGWMHGGPTPSHEKAMKTGAHELRGIMHYSSLRVSGLHFPLMLVMDYKGFRLVAEALLPINKETICYGSSDGGETVHASGEVLCQMMKTVGQELHLAPHVVKNRVLYGPGDQEVHLGLDGRYYCIDLARVFPCEPAKHHLAPATAITAPKGVAASKNASSPARASPSTPPLASSGSTPAPSISPATLSTLNSAIQGQKTPIPSAAPAPISLPLSDEPRSIFYKFLRPEFVLSYKKPLACDCFTGWGKADPMFVQNNKDLVDAFLHLRSFTIPKFADLFDKKVALLPSNSSAKDWWLQEKPLDQLHEMGINIRHLGRVRSHCVVEFARIMILNEMLARTVKNLIRRRLREEMQAQTRLSHEVVKEVAISFFNWVLGKSPYPAPSFAWTAKKAESEKSQQPFPAAYVDFDTDSNRHIVDTTAYLPLSTTFSTREQSSQESGAQEKEFSSPSPSEEQKQVEPTSPSPSASSSLGIADTAFPDQAFFDQLFFQFESALDREELKDPRKAVLQQLDRKMFFARLNQMLGIEMDPEAEKELHHTKHYEFVHCDISSIAPRVRFMNLVDEADGLALYITAKAKRSDQRKRLLRLATTKFQASCTSLPHNFRGLFHWGRSLYEEAKITSERGEKTKIFEEALARLSLVTKLKPLFSDSWIYQVRIWLKLFEAPEYQDKICDIHSGDPLAENFSHLTDQLQDACTRLIRLDLLWSDKLLRRARRLFAQVLADGTIEPTAILKIVQCLCVSIQTVCSPMLEAFPSVPLPPDAVNIKLPRIYAESLLICARALQHRAFLATKRANVVKLPINNSNSSQPVGINQDELHSKRLRFQIAEQFTSALALPHFGDAAHFDRVLLDSMADIAALIKSSKNLTQAFQQRCRAIQYLSFASTSNNAPSSTSLTSASSPFCAPFHLPLDFMTYDASSSSTTTPGGNNSEAANAFVELALPHIGPKLTCIDISGSKYINANALTLILDCSTRTLTALDISELPFVSNSWLSTGLSKLACLEYLSLRGLKITDETAVGLCKQHGKMLKRLDLSYNAITNLGLYRMARELKCLEVLDLSANIHLGSTTNISLTKNIDSSNILNSSSSSSSASVLISSLNSSPGLLNSSATLSSSPSNQLQNSASISPSSTSIPLSSSPGTVLAPQTPQKNPKVETLFADAMTLLRPSLKCLFLLECYSLSNQALWEIAGKLRNITRLALATKQLSDQYLIKLEPIMKQLEALSLKALPNSDLAFSHLLSHLGPNCRHLSLRACMGISDVAITALDRCVNLQTLHIGLCVGVQGSSLSHLSRHLHSLTDIDLAGLNIVDSSDLVCLVSSQPNITSLDLAGMGNPLLDSTLLNILANASKMRQIVLSGNTKLTSRSFDRLPDLVPLLESLNISDCHGLKFIEPTISHLRKLVYLNCKYAHPPRNHGFTASAFSHIQFLVKCNCENKTTVQPAPPGISATLEKEISSKAARTNG